MSCTTNFHTKYCSYYLLREFWLDLCLAVPWCVMKYLNLFSYFDYRQFLADYYTERKKLDSKFSYRWFAARAGIKSVGLYQSLVKGRVGMSERAREAFADAMGMDAREKAYFTLMVNYTHCQDAPGRQKLFEEMIPYLSLEEQVLSKNQVEYYTHWYIVAIHQALYILPFQTNYAELGQFLNPSIGVRETKKAIAVLKKLEMIQQDEDGYWRPCARTVTGSGKEVGTFAIRQFQNNLMDMAKEAQDRIPPDDRNFFTSTMGVSKDGRRRIQKRISEMHQEIMRMVEQDPGEEQICQLNVQFFPLSKNIRDQKSPNKNSELRKESS